MMTLREMELEALNYNLNLRLRESAVDKTTTSGNSQKASEVFRPGQTFAIDANGDLRTLHLTEAAGGDAAKAAMEADIRVFESLGMSRQAAEHAARGRAARSL
jgi:hypothetical protein